jgi:two-component system, sensor histidine kinase YesM
LAIHPKNTVMTRRLMRVKKKFHLKIIHKISIAYVVAIILPIFTVTGIAYVQFYEREKSTIVDTQLTVLRQCEENLDYSLDVIERIGNSISKESRFINYLSNGILGTSYTLKEYQRSISPIFEYSRLIQKVNVHSTRVFIHNTTIDVTENTFYHDTFLLTTPWYTDFLNHSSKAVWIGPHTVDFFVGEENDKRKVYSFCQKLFNSDDVYLGMLVINIYQDELFSDFSKFYGEKNNFFALNLMSNLLYATTDVTPNLSAQQIDTIIKHSRYIYTENSSISMLQHTPRLGILIGIESELENPFFLSKNLILLLVISSIILLFILLIFYYYISDIFKKINEKIFQVNDIIHNNFSSEITVNRYDEIGDISISFNTLIKKINLLIKDIVQKEIAQRDAKLEALQYQINPHFIYNTIEIFSTKMELVGEYETSEAFASFGKILRYNLNNESSFTNLLGEIEHVRSYLKIEQIKYGDRLTLEVNCPEHLTQIKMIKFILQPIVENCLSHGFTGKKNQLIITINVFEKESSIYFHIIDNGTGINEAYKEVLNEVFKTSNYNHPDLKINTNGGIGLKNINERLKLFYTSDSHIFLPSCINGTIIEFKIPIQ